MFKPRTADGHNNISGLRVKELRKALQISQRELSDRLQVVGLDIDKNAREICDRHRNYSIKQVL